jgi:Phytanoyl-CoA dioxygenase (PhyH)
MPTNQRPTSPCHGPQSGKVAGDGGFGEVLDKDRYLFDLNGYIVVRDVLDKSVVEAILDEVREAGVDEALATHNYLHAGFPRDYYDDGDWTGKHGYEYSSDSYILDWGPSTRSLVGHPRVLDYLAGLVGDDFRLDHAYGIFARGPTGPHPLHSGATPFDPTQIYLCRDGRIHNTMVVAQFALTAVGPLDGGFCCIPGSHKANFALPFDTPPLDELDADWADLVRHVAMQPGDILIFTEALTHGALGWRGVHDRKALLFKYCQGAVQWEKESPFVSDGHQWSPVERRIMTGPYAGGRKAVRAPDVT